VEHKQLVAELRRLFAEEKKVQWAIGDVLVEEYGPTEAAGHPQYSNVGTLAVMQELADELGVSLTTLLRYRRMATTYPKGERVATASFSAHESAATAKDPTKVLAEAKVAAERQGKRVITVSSVREIAVKPKHQKPEAQHHARTRPAPDLLDFEVRAGDNLARLTKALSAMSHDDLSPKHLEALRSCVERCERNLEWIRSWLRGGVVPEIEEFLRIS